MNNSFRARSTLKVGDQTYEIWSLAALPQEKLARLPYSLKVLLENLLRYEDGVNVTSLPRRTKLPSRPHGSSCRTLPGFPVSSTLRPCAMPSCALAAAPIA